MIEQNLLKFPLIKFKRKAWRFPQYQAHRGFWVEGAQENTLASMKAAQSKGFQMAECDVRLSRDLVPVIIHDRDLQRLRGQNLQVQELGVSELKKWADIPTLEELLKSKDRPEFLNVEIKGDQILDPRLEILVAQVVEKTKTHEQIIFSTFNPVSILKIKKLLPQVSCGFLINPEKEAGNYIFLRRMWLAPLLPYDFLHLNETMITAELMAVTKQAGIPTVAWTVNKKTRAQALFGLGVVSVITDRILPI